MLEQTYFITAMLSIGMAWAFVRSDPDSATSRALAVALAMIGLAILANNYVLGLTTAGPLPWWVGLFVIPEITAFCAVFEWVLRVRRTIPAGELRTRFGDKALRAAQALIILYGIAACVHPEVRMREFFGGISNPLDWSRQVFVMFAAPLAISMLLWAGLIILCLNRRPDPAERARLVAFLVACPIIVAGLVLPPTIAPVTTALGLIVLLIGALRHAQLNGRRGLFMSRFLSPQVASLVNTQGLRKAMRDTVQELSVVCCDLRGFTRFAGEHESVQVIELLREYYDEVGAAVTEVEGTIKDYAGDGVLILIGAPVPIDDHRARAINLSRRLRVVVGAIAQKWGDARTPLDVGIGVASGPVTVGVVGGEGRLEYAAVGQAVNLAARLCAQAGGGEVLVDNETAARSDTSLGDDVPVRMLELKGFNTAIEALVI